MLPGRSPVPGRVHPLHIAQSAPRVEQRFDTLDWRRLRNSDINSSLLLTMTKERRTQHRRRAQTSAHTEACGVSLGLLLHFSESWSWLDATSGTNQSLGWDLAQRISISVVRRDAGAQHCDVHGAHVAERLRGGAVGRVVGRLLSFLLLLVRKRVHEIGELEQLVHRRSGKQLASVAGRSMGADDDISEDAVARIHMCRV